MPLLWQACVRDTTDSSRNSASLLTLPSPPVNEGVTNCTAVGLARSARHAFCRFLAPQSGVCAKSVLIPQFSMESSTYITSLPIPASVLKQKYLQDGLSPREIAREFSCSRTYIRSLLLKYNIPLREPADYSKDDGRVYGKRKVGFKTVDHKAELRTIAAIKAMYSEGVRIAAIARFLDAMKIPTKQQGRGWQRGMVAKILVREGLHKTSKAQQPELSA